MTDPLGTGGVWTRERIGLVCNRPIQHNVRARTTKQENEVPELAAAIRERGIWPRHRSLAVFWSPSSARDRSYEFNVVGQDTLLGGSIKRVKLDDGSYLNVLDDSNLADFIKHHAWFEGDEVALPREDRMYLLGNLTGQTPKRRRVTQ